MLDTTRPTPLLSTQSSALRQLLLGTHGKCVYREKNPNNVTRRFEETEDGLTILMKLDERQPIGLLSSCLQDGEGRWSPGFTLKRLRQFELTARLGRCDLAQRGYDPDTFVPESLITLSRRIRVHQHTFI